INILKDRKDWGWTSTFNISRLAAFLPTRTRTFHAQDRLASCNRIQNPPLSGILFRLPKLSGRKIHAAEVDLYSREIFEKSGGLCYHWKEFRKSIPRDDRRRQVVLSAARCWA